MSDVRRLAVEIANSFTHWDHGHMLRTARDIERYIETGFIPDDFVQEDPLTNNAETYNSDDKQEEVKNED